jgi:hypothetical protein
VLLGNPRIDQLDFRRMPGARSAPPARPGSVVYPPLLFERYRRAGASDIYTLHLGKPKAARCLPATGRTSFRLAAIPQADGEVSLSETGWAAANASRPRHGLDLRSWAAGAAVARPAKLPSGRIRPRPNWQMKRWDIFRQIESCAPLRRDEPVEISPRPNLRL